MAGKYSKDELKKMLCRSAFHITKEQGIESITVRKLTKGCGLSDPYLYQCYSDVQELLRDAFMKIDLEVVDITKEVIMKSLDEAQGRPLDKESIEKLSKVLWKNYWDYLMEDADRCVFYWRFYQSGYYNKDLLKERQQHYELFIKMIDTVSKNGGLDSKVNAYDLVSGIIDGTVSIAVKIHLGYMEEGATAHIIFDYMLGLFYQLIGIKE